MCADAHDYSRKSHSLLLLNVSLKVLRFDQSCSKVCKIHSYKVLESRDSLKTKVQIWIHHDQKITHILFCLSQVVTVLNNTCSWLWDCQPIFLQCTAPNVRIAIMALHAWLSELYNIPPIKTLQCVKFTGWY